MVKQLGAGSAQHAVHAWRRVCASRWATIHGARAMNVDIDWVVRARAQMHSMRCMPGCFLAAAPSSAEELQRPAAPSEDNFASGVGVEVFWLLAPSPYRAGQVGVRWLQATVCRGCHTDAREERGPIRSRRSLG